MKKISVLVLENLEEQIQKIQGVKCDDDDDGDEEKLYTVGDKEVLL